MLLSLTVKPVISVPGDKTPDMQESDVQSSDEETFEPLGDILELTNRIKAAVPASTEANLPDEGAAATRNKVKGKPKGKGKGVGKGNSGSSGPPVKKTKKTRRPPTPSSSETDSTDMEEEEFEMQEVATQSITVKNKRGYTTYPAFLFDIPPWKLKTDNLRKKLMIAEIRRSHSQRNFYDQGTVFMGFMKEFFRNYSAGNNTNPPDATQQNEHSYALGADTKNRNSESEDNN